MLSPIGAAAPRELLLLGSLGWGRGGMQHWHDLMMRMMIQGPCSRIACDLGGLALALGQRSCTSPFSSLITALTEEE